MTRRPTVATLRPPLEKIGLQPITLMTAIFQIEESFALVSGLAELTEERSALPAVAAHNDTELAHT